MQEEKYNTRDRSYSAWHRRLSTRRFVGIEKAALLAMIDLDASLYVEYDDKTKDPIALMETAIDVGQEHKTATVTLKLAKRADLPCFIVLYTLSDKLNPADSRFQDIDKFRVKRLWPQFSQNDNDYCKWVEYSPTEWANNLFLLRQYMGKKIDYKFNHSEQEKRLVLN